MIPLVGHVEELRRQKKIVLEAAEEVLGKDGSGVEYLIGTMIEVPRGALTADEIAKEAEFFSFGTNDLTQMGFGLVARRRRQFLLLLPGARPAGEGPLRVASTWRASASWSRSAWRRAAARSRA